MHYILIVKIEYSRFQEGNNFSKERKIEKGGFNSTCLLSSPWHLPLCALYHRKLHGVILLFLLRGGRWAGGVAALLGFKLFKVDDCTSKRKT